VGGGGGGGGGGGELGWSGTSTGITMSAGLEGDNGICTKIK